MGVGYNPKIITNGLVGCWDAGNSYRSAKGFKNLLNLSSWTLGTGSATGNGGSTFGRNGTDAENRRILDTGPFGVSTVVWDTPSNDADSNDDGGWNVTSIPIDSSKMYRFSVWMRRKIIGNGAYYLGTMGINASGTNEGVLNRTNGAINTNLYFSATNWPASVLANSWMLVVGHVWPAGSGTGAQHPDSGLWNTSGVKFSNYTSSGDAVWQATNTQTWHRSYLYYSTDTTTNQQWYQPRIDLVDGTQPSIADLISGVGSEWFDIVGSNHGNILNSAQLYNSAGYMNFDGVDDYVDLGNSIQLSDNFTCSFWHKDINGGYILDQGNIGSDPTNCLEVTGYGLYVFPNNGAGGAIADGYATFSTANWNNVVFTFSSGVVKFYINGQLDSTKTISGFTSFSPQGHILKIGRRAFSNSSILSGKIANVSIYNRVLSALEVKQNFNALRGRFGI